MSKHAVEDSSSDQLLNIEEAYQCLLDRSKVHEEGEEFRIRTIITPPLKLQNTEYLHALFVKLLENNEFDIATRLFIIAHDYPRDSEMLENKDIIQYVKSLTQQMVAHDDFKLLQEILFILEDKHKPQSELSSYALTRSKSTEDYQRRLVILLDAVNPAELTTLVTSNYNLLKPEFYPIASKALSSFLEKTTNPEEKQAFFFEMLRGAAIHKNFTFLNSSLLRNFKISKEDKQKLTAKILHSKAGCKDVETLKLLLPRTADSEKKAIILEIVRYAAINDNLEVLRYLLMEVVTDREERQQIINGNNFEIADRLAASRNTDISRFLLMEVVTREKRLEIITRNNFEIFKNLAASGNIDLLEFFLKSFRDPEIQKKNCFTNISWCRFEQKYCDFRSYCQSR